MRAQLEERLTALKAEFKTGQDMLAEVEAKEANLRITLTRISGAIQVLEELLREDTSQEQLPDAAVTSTTLMAA
jgi:predicted nuclease with TOPRIM domain